MIRFLLPALALLAGCVATSGRASPYLQKADDQLLRGEFNQAAGHYEMFLAENPRDPGRARIATQAGKCYLAAGQAARAIRWFDQALGESPDAAVRAEILFRRGVAYRTMGQFSRALEDFRALSGIRAADVDRALTSDERHYETAITLMRAGDWPAGQLEIQQVSDGGAYGLPARIRRTLTVFTIQLGAYTDEAHARRQEERAKALSLDAMIRTVPGEPLLHVVTAGNFPRFEDAQHEADRLRQSEFTDAFVIP